MIVVACIISPTLGCGPHLVNGSNKTVHIPSGPDGMNYELHMDYFHDLLSGTHIQEHINVNPGLINP